jgi:hypothetical protein
MACYATIRADHESAAVRELVAHTDGPEKPPLTGRLLLFGDGLTSAAGVPRGLAAVTLLPALDDEDVVGR